MYYKQIHERRIFNAHLLFVVVFIFKRADISKNLETHLRYDTFETEDSKEYLFVSEKKIKI